MRSNKSYRTTKRLFYNKLGILRNMIDQILRHIGTINNEWIVSNILFSNLTGRIENADKPISINDRMLYVINT